MINLSKFTALLFAFMGSLFADLSSISNSPFREFISPHLPLRASDGKIFISEEIKHVKLDIGLAYHAPMSQNWLTNEENLVVFGFEPNPDSINYIRNGGEKIDPSHADLLDTRFIGKNFFLVPCALGLSTKNTIDFFITKHPCGSCCSIYEPSFFEIKEIIKVPIFSLADFFDVFPFDTHPVIDYIKIDTQGSDLEIAKSAGSYLEDRVVFITIEAENNQYKNTVNSEMDIENYMNSVGFFRYRAGETDDPTYINSRYLDYARENNIRIYQRG